MLIPVGPRILMLLALSAAALSLRAGEEAGGQDSGWFFAAAGKDSSKTLATPGLPLSAAWKPVSLPHLLNRELPGNDVFGWYLRQAVAPAAYRGCDLVLDLGVIDDADVTYANGTEIGRMGDFSDKAKSAWNLHRRYVVPASTIKWGDANLIAVQVKNFTGVGGLLGMPVFGAALTSPHKARFAPGDLPAEQAARPDFDDSKWAEIPLPDEQWDKRNPAHPSWGWYRLRFSVPAGLTGRDLLLDLGMVYDAAAAYLNGQLVGQAGGFPPNFLPQTAGRFRTIAPASLLRPTGNVLAVRVFNDAEFGGLVGVPAVAFEVQERLGPLGKTAKDWVPALLPRLAKPGMARLAIELSEWLVHSGRADDAIALCTAAASSAPPASSDRQKGLGRIVYARWLNGQPAEAWRDFQKLDFSRPIPFEAAHAAAACCQQLRPPEGGSANFDPAPASVAYLGADTATGGNWDRHYGTGLSALGASPLPRDVPPPGGDQGRVALAAGQPGKAPFCWAGPAQAQEPRILVDATGERRRYTCWDDGGWLHPCDDAGPDFLFMLAVPRGAHLVSFYFLDFDWYRGQHPRLQSIVALDAGLHPLLAVATGRFGGGQYQRFAVQGPVTLSFRISKHRGSSAVLSGIFLDRISPLLDYPGLLAPERRGPGLLRMQFANLRDASSVSIPQLVRDPEVAVFMAQCREAAKAPRAPAELLWWMAEGERVQAHFAASAQLLGRFLQALDASDPGHAETDKDRRLRLFGLRDFLLDHGFPNAALLECARPLVAREPAQRDALIQGFRRGSFIRLALRDLH